MKEGLQIIGASLVFIGVGWFILHLSFSVCAWIADRIGNFGMYLVLILLGFLLVGLGS